jgi:hypothetical protein
MTASKHKRDYVQFAREFVEKAIWRKDGGNPTRLRSARPWQSRAWKAGQSGCGESSSGKITSGQAQKNSPEGSEGPLGDR